MVKEILYCDRCGKECEKERYSHFRLWKTTYIITKSFNDKIVDLCQECQDSLAAWVKMEK